MPYAVHPLKDFITVLLPSPGGVFTRSLRDKPETAAHEITCNAISRSSQNSLYDVAVNGVNSNIMHTK